MASITNTHNTDLGLPDGTILKAGAATNVPNWDEVKNNACVKAWTERGILKVGKEAASDDDKVELHAKLDALGVEYDKRAGVAKLRELLAEAEAKAAAAGGDDKGGGA